MRNYLPSLALSVALISIMKLPAGAQWIVHDPANAVILIEQRLNQATQIQRQVDQINNQLRNLRSYTFDWSSIADELRHLRATLSSSTPEADDAALQVQEMDGELGTLAQIQARSNGAEGQLQATQTQTALVAQLVGQVQKQRQLNLAAIMQEKVELKRFKAMGYQGSPVRDQL